MWTLECDGPLFHGRRLWLRPGTSHLFGRRKQTALLHNEESYALDAMSVSKKHLKISIAAVKPGTGSQLHTRSDVTIEEFSKLGTTIDGDKISQETRVLRGDKHVFVVAKYQYPIILKWEPVVFTIVNLSRAEKQAPDALSNYREQLEPVDIKFTKDYVSGKTTHVVAEKRNVPHVLQGLIEARHIVTKEYLQEVVRAATEVPQSSGEGEPKAPLENDFDGSWPATTNYVPPVANEPVKREASYLVPNIERADIFYGFTFVFCMKGQFEQLQPVVNAGSGKAILYESFQEKKSTPEEFVAFVKNAAGEKGISELEDTTQKSTGVVVVRITAKGEAWDTHFVQESDRLLNQRSIEQNEFLETILTVDTSGLRKRLAEEIDLTSTRRTPAPTATRAISPVLKDAPSTLPPRPEPMPAVLRRPKVESRFKGFDAFDDSSDEEQAVPAATQATATRSMPPSSKDVAMEDAQETPASAPTQRTSRLNPAPNARKRAAPDGETVDLLDDILPAAAALKRRRLETQGSAPKAATPEPEPKPVRKSKKEREIDVLAEVQKRREEEEARARNDAENLKEALDGMELKGPANFVEIEEMQLVRSHSTHASRVTGDRSERWDEKWNDRPNFKRFRRKGSERPAGRRQTNFVPMEETKRRDFGIGEEYWLESASRQKESSESQRESVLQTQTLRGSPAGHGNGSNNEEEDGGGSTQFRRKPRTGKSSQVVHDDDDDDDDEVQVVEESLTHRPTTTTASRKRPARESPAEKPQPKKKVADLRRKVESENESEDEDALAFPRRRRAAARKR